MQKQHFRNKYKKKSMAYHRHIQPSSQSDSLFSENLSSNLKILMLKILDEWNEALDKGNFVDATYASCKRIQHPKPWLTNSKTEAYGFCMTSLKYVLRYLHQCLQITGVNDSFVLWKEIIAGVPEGSILGPFLFNIFVNNIFFFVDTAFLVNYVDDTALFSIQNNSESNEVIK